MTSRIIWFRRVLMVGFGLLLIRLAVLQLIQGGVYRRLAEHNRLRLVPQPSPRGLILDRAGRKLATNQAFFQLAVIPQEVTDRPALFARLRPFVNRSVQDLEQRFQEQQSLPFLPATLLSPLSKPQALRLEEARVHLPGVLVNSVITRHYPLGPLAAQVLGYIGQPTAEAFPLMKSYGVRPRDLVGRAGLEEALDAYLRGRPAGSLIEVDARARQVRVIGHREPIPGQPVVLTIDARLQGLIEQQLGQRPGACVVLDPHTGAVLAMVSVPGFEPEVFATQNPFAIRRLLTDPAAPLMNRATQGLYLPGSIAKLVTAITALRHGVITPQTTFECPGSLTIGDRQFHCWHRDGHGPVALRKALTVSCNVYFMQVGRRLGLERLRAGFSQVGFGQPTGWPLGERTGRLPFGRRFSEGEIAILAMGQGEILITPLQAAIMVSVFANRGWLVEPWIVQTVGGHPVGHPHAVSLGWTEQQLAAVHEGMVGVIRDPEGTGIRAQSDKVRIAGKTGTAQTHIPGHPHGWFIGFCPAENPAVSLAIVAEHGGSGGELPASIGKMICEYVAETGIKTDDSINGLEASSKRQDAS